MLLVLGALVLSVTAVTIASRASTVDRMTARADLLARSCDDLAESSRSPILDWLTHRSRLVVLGPDEKQPVVPVLHDRWVAFDRECELEINAWDQCGMVSVFGAASEHPLAQVLQPSVRHHVARIPASWLEHAGADQLYVEGLPLFPSADRQDDGIGVAGLVATHNPPRVARARRGRTPIWVNVNTAPSPLLSEALRLAGLGGLDQILGARAEGSPVGLNLLTPGGAADQSAPIRFVSASSAWGIRIDARVGSFRRSWWEIWINASGQWELAQRLPIHE